MIKNGIYIHIPFCRKKCDYCSFYSIEINNFDTIDKYLDRLVDEIDYVSGLHPGIYADTIYFGGGTPSVLNPARISKVLNRISERFIIDRDAEITIEMNPDDLVPEKLGGFTDAGVNRIVLGVQSLDYDLRGRIGRRGRTVTHSELELFFSHGGFTRCIDIMAGLPGEKESQLLYDLKTVTAYRPEHISLYLLSVDEGTPLGKRFMPDNRFDDMQAELWGISMDFLAGAGYQQYEISNYALPGFESRHNSKYWDFTPYFGFGSGAHSYVDSVRYSNDTSVEDYIKNSKFLYEIDKPSGKSIIVEFLMTSLRRAKGFSSGEFTSVTSTILPETLIGKLYSLKESGFIEISQDRYYLSKKGMYFADSVIYQLSEEFIQ